MKEIHSHENLIVAVLKQLKWKPIFKKREMVVVEKAEYISPMYSAL